MNIHTELLEMKQWQFAQNIYQLKEINILLIFKGIMILVLVTENTVFRTVKPLAVNMF